MVKKARNNSEISCIRVIRDDDGHLLNEENNVKGRWKNYFERLFAREDRVADDSSFVGDAEGQGGIVASLLHQLLRNAGKAIGYLMTGAKQSLYPSIKGKAHGRLIYGSESWVCLKKNESRINAVEIRSRIMGGVSHKDRYRNSDARERCGLKQAGIPHSSAGLAVSQAPLVSSNTIFYQHAPLPDNHSTTPESLSSQHGGAGAGGKYESAAQDSLGDFVTFVCQDAPPTDVQTMQVRKLFSMTSAIVIVYLLSSNRWVVTARALVASVHSLSRSPKPAYFSSPMLPPPPLPPMARPVAIIRSTGEVSGGGSPSSPGEARSPSPRRRSPHYRTDCAPPISHYNYHTQPTQVFTYGSLGGVGVGGGAVCAPPGAVSPPGGLGLYAPRAPHRAPPRYERWNAPFPTLEEEFNIMTAPAGPEHVVLLDDGTPRSTLYILH
ncbi:hypothetical protein EVAR_77344_1 [Eumeta japonica]|uniref:Uncharacterized protein n=1 Tax=Eumeta variegata TaxID=151549 RepID=A0A4C1UXP3_EUMVA|nr:hypothetical protein EVAR_77344_1 [Eumeta japonica]